MRIEGKTSRIIFTQTSHSQQVFPPIRTSAVFAFYIPLYARGPQQGPGPRPHLPQRITSLFVPRDKFVPIRPGSKRSPWVHPRDAGCEFDCSWRIPKNFVQLVEICWENVLNVFTPRALSGYFFSNQIGWTVREGTLVLSVVSTTSIVLAIRTGMPIEFQIYICS